MNRAIADTNVLIVANAKSEASPQCVINCINKLLEIQQGQIILVLDDGELIFNEYKKHLSFTGEPGVGDAFFKWLHDNRYYLEKCEIVLITEISEHNFLEFPQDAALEGFDLSDRKFVAVALAHPEKPPILNAVDSDWRDFETQLAVHGVKIEFLCPDIISS